MGYIFSQRVEFVFFEKVGDFRSIIQIQPHLVEACLYRHVGLYCHQVMAQADMSPGLLELRLLAVSQLVQMGVDILDGAIF